MRRKKVACFYKCLLFFFIVSIFSSSVYASNGSLSVLYRGARAQAMGNAFTALADDEQAIFYNPAGLAGIEDFSFILLRGLGEVSNDGIEYVSKLNSIKNIGDLRELSSVIGKNFYARAQGNSSFVLPGFGLAAIYDEQVSLDLKNASFPGGVLGFQNTYGVQIAFGTELLKFKKNKGGLRFGLGGKFLMRSGGYTHLSISQIMLGQTLAVFNGLKDGLNPGYGVDSGFQMVYFLKKKMKLLAGIAYKDIGDTSFGAGVSPIHSNLTAGAALRYEHEDAVTTLSYDYSHFFDQMDWRKKNHLGLEVKVPVIRLYGGINQIYPTYGLGLDFWLISMVYLSYAEEQGVLVGQNPERRQMVQFSFKFEL